MAYTLVIGTRTWSSWSLRPYLALRATGQPFETVLIPLRVTQHPTSREQILVHSPAGKVPALKIEEGGRTTTVWDSLAIIETLAERHPEAGLLPTDAQARALARSYAAEMHSGFPDLREQLSMEFARRLELPELREATRQQIARILEAWTQALAQYGSDGGFLFGHFSIADCMYAPVVSRFETYGVAVPPQIAAYMKLVMGLEAMADWRKAAEAEVLSGLGLLKDLPTQERGSLPISR
ncbi:MAG TPA: glutathione S-transferase family protein [Rhizomicrobium sp.]|jgi:glutathione S-transferase|nr:glutathione S-transferase family protein [Rhizomicrobium sp.]